MLNQMPNDYYSGPKFHHHHRKSFYFSFIKVGSEMRQSLKWRKLQKEHKFSASCQSLDSTSWYKILGEVKDKQDKP